MRMTPSITMITPISLSQLIFSEKKTIPPNRATRGERRGDGYYSGEHAGLNSVKVRDMPQEGGQNCLRKDKGPC